MVWYRRKTPLEREWELLLKRESAYLKKRTEKKESFLSAKLAEKVPANLQNTLDAAFAKAFELIFRKGTGIIEKTYGEKKRRSDYRIREYSDLQKQNRKSLRAFGKAAQSAGTGNILLSGAAGVGMGLMGVGIPDIPVFTALLLKNIYEIALSFGYGHRSEREQIFILLLIEGALSCGEDCEAIDARINTLIQQRAVPEGYDCEEQIRKSAKALSRELLTMKFLQGIPLVGVVGGAFDAKVMAQIGDYAKLKYQRRLLLRKMD